MGRSYDRPVALCGQQLLLCAEPVVELARHYVFQVDEVRAERDVLGRRHRLLLAADRGLTRCRLLLRHGSSTPFSKSEEWNGTRFSAGAQIPLALDRERDEIDPECRPLPILA